MKLRATIQVDFDTPITAISEHAKRISQVADRLREHYEVVTTDIKERRDRDEKPRKPTTASKRSPGTKKAAELAIAK